MTGRHSYKTNSESRKNRKAIARSQELLTQQVMLPKMLSESLPWANLQHVKRLKMLLEWLRLLMESLLLAKKAKKQIPAKLTSSSC